MRAAWSPSSTVPTVVLQEGGYDIDAIGPNVHAWLTGLSQPDPRFRHDLGSPERPEPLSAPGSLESVEQA